MTLKQIVEFPLGIPDQVFDDRYIHCLLKTV